MPKADVPTLEDHAAKRAAETPVDVWKALLMAALPKRPVATRRPSEADRFKAMRDKVPPIGHPDSAFGEDGEMRVTRQPRGFGGGKRTRAPLNRAYEPTGKLDTSRAGTFRRYMLGVIMAYRTTGAARAHHEDSGKFVDETINFTWAAKEGYITFI